MLENVLHVVLFRHEIIGQIKSVHERSIGIRGRNIVVRLKKCLNDS